MFCSLTTFSILACPMKAAITSLEIGLKEYKHFSFVKILFFQLICSENRQQPVKQYTVICVI